MGVPLTASRRSVVAAVIFTLAICACSDANDPSPGYVKAFVRVTGRDADDGFVLRSDTIVRNVVANNFSIFSAHTGTIQLQLDDVAENCLVDGENPKSVDVSRHDTTRVIFDVGCAATGLSVETHTIGADFPVTYETVLPTIGRVFIGSNGTAEVTRLKPGRYQVSITVNAANCVLVGEREVAVDVVNRQVARVSFNVSCNAIARTGSIAFWSSSQLFLMNADGSNVGVLNKGWNPSWSRDWTRLVYSTSECDYYSYACSGTLEIVDPVTRVVSQLQKTPHGVTPAWSPVDDVIAFNFLDSVGVFFYDLTADRVTKLNVGRSVGMYGPAWSPDGARLVAYCQEAGEAGLCTVNRDGTNLTYIGHEYASDPSWSPDGSSIAYTRWGQDGPRIVTVNPDGTGLKDLTRGMQPGWSPDSRAIAFANQAAGIFIMQRDGSTLRLLTSGYAFDPVWRP